MANLAEKTIDTQGEYMQLDTLLGINFVANTDYYMQFRGECKLCESDSLPTEGGFTVNVIHYEIPQVIYKCKNGSKLYIQTKGPVPVNVAN